MTDLLSRDHPRGKWRTVFSQWGFLIIISLLAFYLFFDFFTKGYVMDGLYDRRNNVLPYYYIFSRAVAGLELPQWNPYLFCGNTLLSNSTFSFFYPLNWPIWLAPEKYIHLLTTAVLSVHFFLAAYFMLLLLREVTKDAFWSLCGTVTYVLSPAVMLSLYSNTEQYQIFVYLPLSLYLLVTFDRRSLVRNIILLTAALALMLLGGMLQFVIYAVGFVLLFAFAQGFRKTPSGTAFDLKPLLILAASLAFAVMISAVRYIPFYLATSDNISFKLSYEEFIRINTTPLPALVRVFFPEFFVFLNRGEYFDAYAGAAAAFFGLYAFFVRDNKTIFWKVLIVLFTLIVMGSPLAYLHYILTGKSNLAFGRLAMFLPLCLAVLLSHIGSLVMKEDKHIRRLMIFSLVTFLLIMAFAVSAYYHNGEIIPAAGYNTAAGKKGMQDAIVHLSVFFFFMMASLAFLAFSKTKHKAGIFKAVLFSIIMIDLFLIPAETYVNSLSPSLVPEPYYKSSELENSIADRFSADNRNFRILGYGEGTSYSRSVSLDLYTSAGYESTPPLYVQTLYTYPYTLPRSMARHITPQSARTLQLSSTKYVIQEDGSAQEVIASLPRYSLYNDVAVIQDDRGAMETILGMRGPFDPAKTVAVSKPPAIPIQQTDTAVGQIRLTDEKMNSLSFDVATPVNTLLLVNDTYDEGWQAYVDGGETEILRANYAFRAVSVPAGIHKVRFAFSQKGFREGLIISVSACLMFISLTLFHLYRSRAIRQRGGASEPEKD